MLSSGLNLPAVTTSPHSMLDLEVLPVYNFVIILSHFLFLNSWQQLKGQHTAYNSDGYHERQRGVKGMVSALYFTI